VVGVLRLEAVEGHGVGEASGHDLGQEGQGGLVEVGGGDVPAVEGVAIGIGIPALAAPAADRLGGEARGDMLGLLVGVGLDPAAVGGDGDEPRLAAVVVEELDELTLLHGLALGQPGLGATRVDPAVELVLGPQAPPAGEAHVDDGVGALGADLADRVEPKVAVGPVDADLVGDGAADGGQPGRVDRAVLAVGTSGPPGRAAPS
jgi:hypothetical protein